jgi:hypothetical protein
MNRLAGIILLGFLVLQISNTILAYVLKNGGSA